MKREIKKRMTFICRGLCFWQWDQTGLVLTFTTKKGRFLLNESSWSNCHVVFFFFSFSLSFVSNQMISGCKYLLVEKENASETQTRSTFVFTVHLHTHTCIITTQYVLLIQPIHETRRVQGNTLLHLGSGEFLGACSTTKLSGRGSGINPQSSKHKPCSFNHWAVTAATKS